MSKYEIIITGNCRDIANSAWISTTDEIRTKSRTDEDVDRVVSFLAKNMHTSPFECVTITVKCSLIDVQSDHTLGKLVENKFSKISKITASNQLLITIDLLNFSKVCYFGKFASPLWMQFKKDFSNIAEKVMLFDFAAKHKSNQEINDSTFEKQMKVELIDFHDIGIDSHARATWRVRCPLSIAVQILRHRTGSFNMVSGRYKTIKQENISIPDDIIAILDKADSGSKENSIDSLVDEILCKMNDSKEVYLETMKELKRCKTEKIITNDEYKRMREYVRFVLPEGRMTELYITFYMPDFRNFIMLRDSAHAQIEHIWIAQRMKKTLEKVYKNF